MAILRQSVRALGRARWYSFTIASVIALCIALSATVFAVVDGVLFKPLPFKNPEQLYLMNGGWVKDPRNSGVSIAPRNLRDWTAAVPGAVSTALSTGLSSTVVGDIRGWAPIYAGVDRHFFEVLGLQPLVGGFAAADFLQPPGAPKAALISYPTWQGRFGGRTDIIGQPLATDNFKGSLRVAGVLGKDFVYPWMGQPPEILIADDLAPAADDDLHHRLLTGLVRLPDSSNLAEHQSRMDAAAMAEGGDWVPRPREARGAFDRVSLRSLPMMMTSSERPTFTLAMSVAVVLLLLGCLNISGLMASRALERQREYSVRRALGAGPFAIARALVSENAVVIAVGSLAGLLIARPILSITMRLLPDSLGLLKAPSIDFRVALFAAAMTLAAACVTSIWPVLRAIRQPTALDLSSGAKATVARSWSRSAAIAAQIALALPMTLGGVLIVGSLLQLWRVDPGYDAERVVILQGRTTATDAASRDAALGRIEEQLRATSGVMAVGTTQSSFGQGVMMNAFITGYTIAIRPGFFDALGPRLVAGRLLTDNEIRSNASMAVITEKVAEKTFGSRPAVGQPLKGFVHQTPQMFEVVGVIKDVRVSRWDDDSMGQIFAPFGLVAAEQTSFSAVVRASRADDVLAAVVASAKARASDAAFVSAASGGDILRETVRLRRFNSWLFGTFAVSALVIVGVGVLGLIAMTSARRTREVGIRMALGSTPRGIVGLLLREQLVAVGLGVVGGGLLSYWGVAFVKVYLYRLTATDPRLWAVGAVVTITIAMVGALIPAIRASRIDPSKALRAD